MIGDLQEETTEGDQEPLYGNFFESGCLPRCPSVVVDAVEADVRLHMSAQGLGCPLNPDPTVAGTLSQILMCQGAKIEGAKGAAFAAAANVIMHMVSECKAVTANLTAVKASAAGDSGSSGDEVILLKDTVESLKEENALLRAQVSGDAAAKKEIAALKAELESLRKASKTNGSYEGACEISLDDFGYCVMLSAGPPDGLERMGSVSKLRTEVEILRAPPPPSVSVTNVPLVGPIDLNGTYVAGPHSSNNMPIYHKEGDLTKVVEFCASLHRWQFKQASGLGTDRCLAFVNSEPGTFLHEVRLNKDVQIWTARKSGSNWSKQTAVTMMSSLNGKGLVLQGFTGQYADRLSGEYVFLDEAEGTSLCYAKQGPLEVVLEFHAKTKSWQLKPRSSRGGDGCWAFFTTVVEGPLVNARGVWMAQDAFDPQPLAQIVEFQ